MNIDNTATNQKKFFSMIQKINTLSMHTFKVDDIDTLFASFEEIYSELLDFDISADYPLTEDKLYSYTGRIANPEVYIKIINQFCQNRALLQTVVDLHYQAVSEEFKLESKLGMLRSEAIECFTEAAMRLEESSESILEVIAHGGEQYEKGSHCLSLNDKVERVENLSHALEQKQAWLSTFKHKLTSMQCLNALQDAMQNYIKAYRRASLFRREDDISSAKDKLRESIKDYQQNYWQDFSHDGNEAYSVGNKLLRIGGLSVPYDHDDYHLNQYIDNLSMAMDEGNVSLGSFQELLERSFNVNNDELQIESYEKEIEMLEFEIPSLKEELDAAQYALEYTLRQLNKVILDGTGVRVEYKKAGVYRHDGKVFNPSSRTFEDMPDTVVHSGQEIQLNVFVKERFLHAADLLNANDYKERFKVSGVKSFLKLIKKYLSYLSETLQRLRKLTASEPGKNPNDDRIIIASLLLDSYAAAHRLNLHVCRELEKISDLEARVENLKSECSSILKNIGWLNYDTKKKWFADIIFDKIWCADESVFSRCEDVRTAVDDYLNDAFYVSDELYTYYQVEPNNVDALSQAMKLSGLRKFAFNNVKELSLRCIDKDLFAAGMLNIISDPGLQWGSPLFDKVCDFCQILKRIDAFISGFEPEFQSYIERKSSGVINMINSSVSNALRLIKEFKADVLFKMNDWIEGNLNRLATYPAEDLFEILKSITIEALSSAIETHTNTTSRLRAIASDYHQSILQTPYQSLEVSSHVIQFQI